MRRNASPCLQVVNPPDCEGEEQICAAKLSAVQEDDDLCTSKQPETTPELLFFRVQFVLLDPAVLFAEGNNQPFIGIPPCFPLHFSDGTGSRVLLTDHALRPPAIGSNYVDAWVNNITYSPASVPLLLAKPGQVSTCNESSLPASCEGKPSCVCPHLVKVPYKTMVNVLFVDHTDSECCGHTVPRNARGVKRRQRQSTHASI